MTFDTTDSVGYFVDYILIDIEGKDPYDRNNEIQVNRTSLYPEYYYKNNTQSFSFSTNTDCYVMYDGPGTITVGTDTATCPTPGSLYVEADNDNNSFTVYIDSGENSCGGDVTVTTYDHRKSLEGTIKGSEGRSNECDSGYRHNWESLEIMGFDVE